MARWSAPVTAVGFQNNPEMTPLSSISMLSAAGSLGRPGMVMMSPVYTTTKPAPAETRAVGDRDGELPGGSRRSWDRRSATGASWPCRSAGCRKPRFSIWRSSFWPRMPSTPRPRRRRRCGRPSPPSPSGACPADRGTAGVRPAGHRSAHDLGQFAARLRHPLHESR